MFNNFFNNDKSGNGKKKSNSSNNNNNNNNPLANLFQPKGSNNNRKSGGRRLGPGQSLGGSKPGEVFSVVLSEPGTLGVRVEKRSNNSASAIVSNVVEGSQAEASGLRRGDVLCFAGSDGQDEIPYEMFLQIARSKDRPIRECLRY